MVWCLKPGAPKAVWPLRTARSAGRSSWTAGGALSRCGRLDRVLMTTCAWELAILPGCLRSTARVAAQSCLHSMSGGPELAACCCRYSAATAQGYSLEMTPANSIMLLPGGGRSPTPSSTSGSLPLTAGSPLGSDRLPDALRWATCASAFDRPSAARLVSNAGLTVCCKLSSDAPHL